MKKYASMTVSSHVGSEHYLTQAQHSILSSLIGLLNSYMIVRLSLFTSSYSHMISCLSPLWFSLFSKGVVEVIERRSEQQRAAGG